MRVEALQPLTGGINRLRTKGGADPRQLYDLVNGYVDQDGSVRSRPGTVKDYDVPGTKGLCSANGKLVVFSEAPTEVPEGVECMVLLHPTDPALTLHKIHFAAPFLGDENGAALYVVAEFNNGDVFHYWLIGGGSAWESGKVYGLGDIVTPGNGLSYRATRLNPAAPVWTPDAARTVGDVVEPTTFNKYKYTVIDTTGDSPASGSVEPDWPTEDGATVYETNDVDLTPPPSGNDRGDLPESVKDRYNVRFREAE